MGKEKRVVGYNDWDTVVKIAESNIDILIGNKMKADMGLMSEKMILDYALRQRDKFLPPIIMEETETPVEDEATEEAAPAAEESSEEAA